MKIVFPSVFYGRTIQTWLCYNKLPFWIGARSFIIDLNEGQFDVPVPFLHIVLCKGGNYAD